MAQDQGSDTIIKDSGTIIARLVLVSIVGLLGWLVLTVHNLSIHVAVMQSQLDRIETYWTRD